MCICESQGYSVVQSSSIGDTTPYSY
ncbi:MAG: hypothetical protein EOL87_18015 [Spartobacteria bacterium]|nr:hypothetical protein [Spartobacteria bacterium]